MNIGDNIVYRNGYGEKCKGTVVNIHSDMDSYDEIRLENGIPLYYSKKLSKFVPVKPKNMDSVFLEVFKSDRVCNEFVGFTSVA